MSFMPNPLAFQIDPVDDAVNRNNARSGATQPGPIPQTGEPSTIAEARALAPDAPSPARAPGTPIRVERTVVGGFIQPPTNEFTGPWNASHYATPTLQPEMLTEDALLREFHRMDRAEREALEEKLYIAGFYGNVDLDDYQGGRYPHPRTLDAVRRFFQYAADVTSQQTHALPWQNILDNTVDDVLDSGGGPGGGGGLGNQVVSLSDPAGLRAVLKNTYKQLVGKAPSKQELRAFTAAIHSAQRNAQTAEWNARAAGQTEGVVEMTHPSPEARAIEFAEEQRPTETQAKGIQNAADVVRQMVGGTNG